MYHLHKWSQEEWEAWLPSQSEATQAYYHSWNRRQNDVLVRQQQRSQQEPEEPHEPNEPEEPTAAPTIPGGPAAFVDQVHMAATGVPKPSTGQAVPAGPEAMQSGSPAGPPHEGFPPAPRVVPPTEVPASWTAAGAAGPCKVCR
ncbi:unnamed protein product [Symbiodinium necroappetens]|uniref:Uncharacterized protein n=1 Tax=Symbiodinium necroappetens TaxID=1628268 RepID=A0A812XTD7_9DINO|nr:unnamed protein product [Symbiodinium necroappetens]